MKIDFRHCSVIEVDLVMILEYIRLILWHFLILINITFEKHEFDTKYTLHMEKSLKSNIKGKILMVPDEIVI